MIIAAMQSQKVNSANCAENMRALVQWTARCFGVDSPRHRKIPLCMLLVSIISFNCGCTPSDPIDRLVKKMSSDPLFQMGMYRPIVLPVTASPAQVASTALGESLTNVVVVETRQVLISYDNQFELAPETTKYTAVVVNTKSGRKIVLIQYRNNRHSAGWWSSVYDVNNLRD